MEPHRRAAQHRRARLDIDAVADPGHVLPVRVRGSRFAPVHRSRPRSRIRGGRDSGPSRGRGAATNPRGRGKVTMLLLVEICAALAGLAVVAMAVAAFRAVHVLERTSRRVVELTGEMHRWIAEAGELTREARDTMVSVQAVVVPLRRAA